MSHRYSGLAVALFCAWAGLMPAMVQANAAIVQEKSTDACVEQSYYSPTPGGNNCLHALHDGLAAIALSVIDKGASNDRGAGSRLWGFIDTHGKLVIKPRFGQVGDFHHGLAPAYDGKHWGYINTDGDWAIDPKFDAAGNFADIGIAAVQKGGRWQLIDRDGQPASIDLGKHIKDIQIRGGTPAKVRVRYNAVYQNDAGEDFPASDDIELDKGFGDDGMLVASRDGKQGIVDSEMNWKVQPVYDRIELYGHDARVAYAQGGPKGAALIRSDGRIAIDNLRSARQFGDLWIGTGRDGAIAIVNAAGTVLERYGADSDVKLQRLSGGYLAGYGDKQTTILGPTFEKPVHMASDQASAVEARRGDTLFVYKGRRPTGLALPGQGTLTGIVLPGGRLIKVDDAHPQLASAAKVDKEGEWLWFLDNRNGIVNVAGPDGRLLLDSETAKKVHQYGALQLNVTAPDTSEPPRVIALLTGCHCSDSKVGVLLSDGSIQLHDDWQSTGIPGLQPGYTYRETVTVPRVYTFRTDDGVGLIDAHGQVILKPRYSRVGEFHHDYAFVFGNGIAKLVGRQGNLYAIPQGFNIKVVAPGLVRYQETAAIDAALSLFDLKTQKTITQPIFKSIGTFDEGYAIATSARGKAGVIDLKGNWVVAPKYAAISSFDGRHAIATSTQGKIGVVDTKGHWLVKPVYTAVSAINANLWFVARDKPEDKYATVPRAVVNAQGKQLTPYAKYLKASTWPDGRVEIGGAYSASGPHLLLSAAGKLLIDGHKTHFARIGSLLSVNRSNVTGYMGADGQWAIAPAAVKGTAFGKAGYALRFDGDATRIINTRGDAVARLPAGQWYLLAGGKWVMGIVNNDGGKQQAVLYDPAGLANLVNPAHPEKRDTGDKIPEVPLSRDNQFVWYPDSQQAGYTLGQLASVADGASAQPVRAIAGQRYGFADAAGMMRIPPVYAAATAFTGNRAVVGTDASAMMIDPRGGLVARVANQCGVRVLYGPGNQRIWPQALPDNYRCGNATAGIRKFERREFAN